MCHLIVTVLRNIFNKIFVRISQINWQYHWSN